MLKNKPDTGTVISAYTRSLGPKEFRGADDVQLAIRGKISPRPLFSGRDALCAMQPNIQSFLWAIQDI